MKHFRRQFSGAKIFYIYTFILFLFELIFLCNASMKVVNCNKFGENSTVTNLATNEYVLFQTPKFPFNEDEYCTCEHKFARSDNESNIWFVFLNGHINYFYITCVAGNNNDDFDTKEYLWRGDTPPQRFTQLISYSALEFYVNDIYDIPKWWGFQAFIYAPNPEEKKSCPFNGKTFILENNFDIIPITSNFNYEMIDVSNYFKNCTWNFEIPLGFQLKFNLKYTNINMPEALSMTVDDDDKPISFNLYTIRYFNGTKFTIYYENIGGFEFASLITAVEDNPIIKNQSCYKNITENGITTIFGNYDIINGYENNEVCEIKIPVNNSTLELSYFGYLDDGDLIQVYNNVDEYPENRFTDYPPWILDKNISEATLNFSSDGSIVSGGFQVNITELSCECSNQTQIFSCESEVHFFNVFKDGGFCSGVSCNFTLTSDPKCGNYSSLLIPKGELRYFAKDSIKIYENNKLLLSIISDVTPPNNHFLFNPKSKITINFKSDKTLFGLYQAPSISFGIANINTTWTIINLTPENFTYTLDTYFMERSFFTVNAPENYTLDLFVVKFVKDPTSDLGLKNIFLYESNTTENYIGTLFDLHFHKEYNLLRYYTERSNSLTLFKSFHAGELVAATLFFRIREIHSQNCEDMYNVFYASNTTFMAKATETGPCLVTVLVPDLVIFNIAEHHHFETDATTENVKFVAGVNPNYTFFEFNSETASTWPRLFFYGSSNSFIIPANSYLKFTSEFYLGPDGYKWYNLKKGLHTSKTFVNPWTIEDSATEIYVRNDTTCRLTVMFLDLSQNASLNLTVERYIPKEEAPLMVTQVDQTFDFKTTKYPDYLTISINFQEPIIGHRGYVIEFEMLPPAKANSNSVVNFLFVALIYFINTFLYFN